VAATDTTARKAPQFGRGGAECARGQDGARRADNRLDREDREDHRKHDRCPPLSRVQPPVAEYRQKQHGNADDDDAKRHRDAGAERVECLSRQG
jgi:hypothetical protein